MQWLESFEDEEKELLVDSWKGMSNADKGHFINQVALALSIWGSDRKGKDIVIEILKRMTSNGSSTLADFGLYIEDVIGVKETAGMEEQIKRAALVIEGYRIKNALPSEPHRPLV